MNKKIQVKVIVRENEHGKYTNGALFIFPDGREIQVDINSNEPDYITISADDRISIVPWSTNLIRVKM